MSSVIMSVALNIFSGLHYLLESMAAVVSIPSMAVSVSLQVISLDDQDAIIYVASSSSDVGPSDWFLHPWRLYCSDFLAPFAEACCIWSHIIFYWLGFVYGIWVWDWANFLSSWWGLGLNHILSLYFHANIFGDCIVF